MPVPFAATPVSSTVATSTTSATALAANTGRVGATFFNDSAVVLYLRFSATAATAATATWALAAGTCVSIAQILGPGVTYTGAVTAITASSTGNVRVTEFT